jgi:hypothetical protein
MCPLGSELLRQRPRLVTADQVSYHSRGKVVTLGDPMTAVKVMDLGCVFRNWSRARTLGCFVNRDLFSRVLTSRSAENACSSCGRTQRPDQRDGFGLPSEIVATYAFSVFRVKFLTAG